MRVRQQGCLPGICVTQPRHLSAQLEVNGARLSPAVLCLPSDCSGALHNPDVPVEGATLPIRLNYGSPVQRQLWQGAPGRSCMKLNSITVLPTCDAVTVRGRQHAVTGMRMRM